MNTKISLVIAITGLAVVLMLSGGSLSTQSASADSNQVASHNKVSGDFNFAGEDLTQCTGSLTSSSCTGNVDNSVTNTGGGSGGGGSGGTGGDTCHNPDPTKCK